MVFFFLHFFKDLLQIFTIYQGYLGLFPNRIWILCTLNSKEIDEFASNLYRWLLVCEVGLGFPAGSDYFQDVGSVFDEQFKIY